MKFTNLRTYVMLNELNVEENEEKIQLPVKISIAGRRKKPFGAEDPNVAGIAGIAW